MTDFNPGGIVPNPKLANPQMNLEQAVAYLNKLYDVSIQTPEKEAARAAANAERKRQEEERRETQSKRHAELLAHGDVIVRKVAELHSPDWGSGSFWVDCQGCDGGSWEEGFAHWPCRTWELLNEAA